MTFICCFYQSDRLEIKSKSARTHLNMSSVTLNDAAALRAVSNIDVDICVKTPTACVILVQYLHKRTPHIIVELYIYTKDTTEPERYKQFYLRLVSEFRSSGKIFADGSRTDEEVLFWLFVCFAAAAVSYKYFRKPYTYRLRDNSSINTGKLQAIILTLRHTYHFQGKSFLIMSSSLSSPPAIFDMKCNHLILAKNPELHLELTNS